jgi:hypothetical protein
MMNIGGIWFSNLQAFDLRPPVGGGLYGIVSSNWLLGGPAYGRVLYIGQSASFRGRVTRAHECYGRFVSNMRLGDELLVAYLPMPASTEHDRCRLEALVIAAADPPCNRQNPLADLLGSLLRG